MKIFTVSSTVKPLRPVTGRSASKERERGLHRTTSTEREMKREGQTRDTDRDLIERQSEVTVASATVAS